MLLEETEATVVLEVVHLRIAAVEGADGSTDRTASGIIHHGNFQARVIGVVGQRFGTNMIIIPNTQAEAERFLSEKIATQHLQIVIL